DPLGTMERAFAETGGAEAVFIKLGPYQATLLRHPDLIRRVFVENASNYSKMTRGYAKSKIVLGQGLVTSEGELWQRQRRIANPAFHRSRVHGFGQTFVRATSDMLDGWHGRADASASVDVFTELMRCTLRIAAETLLGVRADAELDSLAKTVSLVLERTNDIITNPLSPPIGVPTYKNVTFKRAIRRLDQFVYAAIEQRRRTPDPASTDLLSILMAAQDDEQGTGGMSDKQLRDEAVTILIAGHETVANALSWTLHLLGQHPAYWDELAAEARAVAGDRAPTIDDLPNLKLTRAVIDEGMRLYPPAWMIGRAATEADVVGGYRIDKGTFVLVSPYMTHRHPGLWQNAAAFDPARFLPGGEAERLPKFSYLPFGGGPRFCIGSTFALVEATLVLATIARRCSLAPDPAGPAVEPYAMITLRPRNGIRVTPRWR
ncbi:MAG TPA: cytochrome P450, partial [Tepidisphaeraceae bacterium]|nr:cytochrome P450 [Tepidisphaeraceae bacterium]